MKTLMIIFITLFGLNSYAAFTPQGTTTVDKGEINIEGGQLPTISLTFKNTGSSVDTLSLGAVNPNYKISVNRCNNVAPNKTCQVSLAPQRAPSLGVISFNFNGFSISMEVVRKDSQGNPIVPVTAAIMEFVPSTISDIVFSSSDKSKTISFNVKNTGKSSAVPSISWVSNLNNARTTVNRCVSSLPPGKTCSITIVFNKPTSNISQSLNLTYTGDGSPKSLSFSLKLDTTSNADCNFNGSPVLHGQSIQAYSSSSVPFGQTCIAEQRTCNNGVLSGSNSLSSCVVDQATSCIANSITYQHGDTVPGFSQAMAMSGQTCSSFATSGTCNNGIIDNSPSSFTCDEFVGISCLFGTQTIAAGGITTGYTSLSVPYGQVCETVSVSCDGNSGIFSPFSAVDSCYVESPVNCDFNGQTISHGANVEAFSQGTVPFGQTCTSEIRSCDNGMLSGSNSFSSCIVEQPSFTPGFKLVSNVNEPSVVTNQNLCSYLDLNDPQIVHPILTGNPMFGEETLETISDSFECDFMVQNSFQNAFSVNTTPSQADPDLTYCFSNNYGFSVTSGTYEIYNNCNDLVFFVSIMGEISMRSVPSSTAPILGFDDIHASIGVNDSIYFISQKSVGQGLYKVNASDDMDINPAHSNTPSHLLSADNIDSNSFTLLGNNLVYEKQVNGSRYVMKFDTSVDTESPITIPCPIECSIQSTMKGDSSFYVSAWTYNGAGNDAYVYRTTDGNSFSLVATLLGGNSETFPTFTFSTEFNGYVYYKRTHQSKLMRFKNDGTTFLEELPYVVRHLFKVNNRAFVITEESSPKIYEIDSSNNFILRHTVAAGRSVSRVVTGSSLFYFTLLSSPTNDLWKFDLTTSSSSLVKADYTGGPTFCSSAGDNEFVNKISDSFVFACNNNPSNTTAIKILSKTGVETRYPNVILSTTQNSPFYWNHFYGQKNVAYYRNKAFFYGDSVATGSRLYTLDSNDVLNPFFMSNPSLNQQEVRSNAPLLIFKDNLFFIGNNHLDLSIIPSGKFEIYKYYENP